MRIYIYCIEFVQTGGIELLHQLCHEFNHILGCEAIMLYSYNTNERGNNPVPQEYNKYDNPYIVNRWISDNDVNDAFFIVPEVSVTLFEENHSLYACKHKCIYWESVDNYFKATPQEYHMNFLNDDSILHLTQSEYAKQFLLVNGIDNNRILEVSDYLNDTYLSGRLNDKLLDLQRDNVVLFNPRKGFDFTKKIIDALPDVTFIPIEHMTPEEIYILMHKCKVYIDFGEHPGKDRIPREAAICGLIVITGRDGSAANNVDVPIPEECKFERTDENIQSIADQIRTCLDLYDEYFAKYEKYRERIKNEPALFSKQVRMAAEHIKSLMQKDVKIYVAGHIDFVCPDSSEYIPQRIDQIEFCEKKELYCELVALYHISQESAKEGSDDDIIGLEQYKRFLCTPNGEQLLDICACNIILDRYDFILPKSNEISYSRGALFLKVYDKIVLDAIHDILLGRQTEYVGFWEKCLNNKEGHYHNLFISKKKHFLEYSKWLFDILFELHSRIDKNLLTGGVMSHISEILLDVYLEKNGYTYYEVPVCNSEWS